MYKLKCALMTLLLIAGFGFITITSLLEIAEPPPPKHCTAKTPAHAFVLEPQIFPVYDSPAKTATPQIITLGIPQDALTITFDTNDVRKPSNLTEQQIHNYLERFPSLQPISGIIAQADSRGLNAIFALAVIRLESGNGRYIARDTNIGGIKCFWTGDMMEYGSIEAGAEAFVWLLLNSYLCYDGMWHRGASIECVRTMYEPSCEEWTDKVAGIMREIYGRINE